MPRALLAAVVLLVLAACGDDPSAADERADQLREVAEEAGLPEDVIDVLALAARGIDGTFQVTFPGEDGSSVVVSQAPPDRRIDVIVGDRVVRSQVLRGGVGYSCEPPADDPAGALECERTRGALEAPGAFTEEALETFTEELGASLDELILTVEERTIAEVEATCLVAGPDAGPSGGTAPDVETICLSDEGAQLLIDVAGERLEADGYTTEVPEGTFDT